MRIGIDLGGTKTEIICLNKINGKELYRQRIPTARGDYPETVKAISSLVLHAEGILGETGTVGIGIPGTISSETGHVKNANSIWINGHSLDKDLSDALNRPIRIENDANCFAVSEAIDGAGQGKRVVFGAIIGTGCGGGVAVDGKAIRGPNGICGEWGHNPLPYPRVFSPDPKDLFDYFEKHPEADEKIKNYFEPEKNLSEYPGPLCYCGRRGCLETWISGTGFKNDYFRVMKDNKSTHDIINEAKTGHKPAVETLQRYTDRLARSLAQIANTIDPDVIVLGGGMSNVSSLYLDLSQIWKKYIFSDTVVTEIVPARHGDSSGVRGAAWLWGQSE